MGYFKDLQNEKAAFDCGKDCVFMCFPLNKALTVCSAVLQIPVKSKFITSLLPSCTGYPKCGEEWWRSSVNLYIFVLSTSSVCVCVCLVLMGDLGSRCEAALMTLWMCSQIVSKIAVWWMRLACKWEWVGSKLRNSEKMLVGRGNWPRSVRHDISCCGWALSLCHLCCEFGRVVAPACNRVAEVATTTGSISVWPAGLCYWTWSELYLSNRVQGLAVIYLFIFLRGLL